MSAVSDPRCASPVLPTAKRCGDANEDLGALVRRQRFPHRLFGRVHCLARLRSARPRDATNHAARVRRPHFDPVAGLDPFAADQQAFFGERGDHEASLDMHACLALRRVDRRRRPLADREAKRRAGPDSQ